MWKWWLVKRSQEHTLLHLCIVFDKLTLVDCVLVGRVFRAICGHWASQQLRWLTANHVSSHSLLLI